MKNCLMKSLTKTRSRRCQRFLQIARIHLSLPMSLKIHSYRHFQLSQLKVGWRQGVVGLD